MTVSVSLKSSTNLAFTGKPTQVSLIVRVSPTSFASLSGIHYVVMIDNSPSMKKENKINLALAAASRLVQDIIPGNFISIYLFSNNIETLYEGESGKEIDLKSINMGYTTNLHKAITKVLEKFRSSEIPVKIILLSDGKPTDKRYSRDYESLQIPKNVQLITIGLGEDYNEAIMKILADKGSGVFYHINDPSQLPTTLVEQKSDKVAAYNLTLNFSEGLEVINYEMPVNIPVVDRDVNVYAVGNIPPGETDYILKVTGNYVDSVNNKNVQIDESLAVKRAPDDEVRSNFDRTVINEVSYYMLLRYYGNLISEGKSEEATRVVPELLTAAERTKRVELIERTKKLVNDPKVDLSEVTKTMRT
ncbi:hypothetical protein SUSAZ_05755 [Sulfolobus acidocaldarius SUSAZ]|nr:hypothetical protein SUSAZ_05755 [Sulfolobus acidocaldarius SUSAZ]